MSEHFPECPAYNHYNCRDLHNPKICAVVREDKACLRKHQKSRKTHEKFKETVERIKDQKPKLEAFLDKGHIWHHHSRRIELTKATTVMATENKRTDTIKDIGKYVYWKQEGLWVGYCKEYPEYWSQGETKVELRKGLLKIYKKVKP